MFHTIRRYRQWDPAASGYLEVILFYPGLKALLFHRIAHALWKLKVPLIPRLICEVSKLITTIEIHPGAVIGRGLVIDHGLGAGIGETAIVGNDVTMLPGAVLGAAKFKKGRRHPKVEDGAFIGIGAKILGDITIGKGAKIGANAVVVKDVPAFATAVGIPAHIIPLKTNVKSLSLDESEAIAV